MREPVIACPPHSFDEPAARPASRRPRAVVPEHVCLAVRIDPAVAEVRGTVTHTVRARAVPVARVTLDAADLVVEAVRCDGVALQHHPHVGGVDVIFAEPVPPGGRVTFSLTFVAHPTAGLYFVDGDPPQVWTQGAMEDHHHWFPCFDAPEHMVTTEVIAEVPQGYEAVSNGVPAAAPERLAEGWQRFHWRHDTPHALYLLTLVVDRLATVRDDAGPVPLVHYVPPGREEDARLHFARTSAMFAFFAESTGVPYPYPRYGHVFLREFMWGGMENTTLTSLTDRVLVPGAQREIFDTERLVAHELAHQWFGDLIAPRGWPEIWLNESFATYFEVLCMGALDGEDELDRRLLAQRDGYLEEAEGRYARPVVTRRYAHPYVLFDRHAYEKGSQVLHTLRDQIGEGAFWAGVRAYVARARGRAAETAELRRAFEEASGEDLGGFFEQMVYGAAHPKAEVEWSFDPRVGLELSLQRTDQTTQSLYLDVWAEGRGATHRRVRLAPGARTLVLPLPEAPRWVAVDPHQRCLVELDESRETTAVLLARLEAAAPRMLRVRTVRLLAERGDPRVTAALAHTLAHDASSLVRTEAALALGQHRSEAARAHLAQVVDGTSGWRTRMGAARAFGVGADDAHVEQLEAWFARERNPRVRCAILTSLGQIRTEAAAAVVTRGLEVASPRDCVAAAAVSALAAQQRPEAIDAVLACVAPERSLGLRSAAVRGLGGLAKVEGLDAGRVRALREAIEGTLADRIFHVRWAAADALKALGDAKSAPALRRAHGAERFALLRRVLREALGAVEAG